jgi:hypothetical protein
MQFSEPPPRRTRRSEKWITIVNELKANPGQFALIGNFSPGVPAQIRAGTYPSFIGSGIDMTDKRARRDYMSQHWEVVTRTQVKDRLDVWIRWLG